MCDMYVDIKNHTLIEGSEWGLTCYVSTLLCSELQFIKMAV